MRMGKEMTRVFPKQNRLTNHSLVVLNTQIIMPRFTKSSTVSICCERRRWGAGQNIL